MNNPIISWRHSPKKYQYLNIIGKIVCLTKIYVPTADFSSSDPYFVGIIDFKKKGKIIGQIINETDQEIKIGHKVIGVIRRGKGVGQSEIVEYLVKFKLNVHDYKANIVKTTYN